MKLSYLSLLLALTLFIPFKSSAEENWDLKTDYNHCIKATDAGRQGNGQYVIRFYNSCPMNLFINACVMSDEGIRLYMSNLVKYNANFTIYTSPFDRPFDVNYSSDPVNPVKPGQCSQLSS